jgi:photosystem II stability/assembly factor-like uncharacterized protein
MLALLSSALAVERPEFERKSWPLLRGKSVPIADPRVRELEKRLREGRATGPLHRAWYEFVANAYPYDRLPSPDTRSRAVAKHRENLAARQEAFASGRLDATAFGGHWISIGPRNVPGRMTAIALHPTDRQTLWVAGADGGIWKTTDAGATWTPKSDFEENLSIGSMILDPQDPDTIYVGTGEGNFSSDRVAGSGLLKSTDSGSTWRMIPIAPPWGRGIRRLDIDPLDRRTLFAAADNALLRSTDAGESWAPVAALPSKGWDFATDLLRDPSDSATLFAAFGDIYGENDPSQATPGIWKSTDRGATWAQLAGGLPTTQLGRIVLASSPALPGTFYASVGRNSDDRLLGLFVTSDGGTTWTKKVSTPNYCEEQCWYDNVLAVDPVDPKIVWAGGIDVWRSSDSGESFTKVSNWWDNPSSTKYVHADQHFFAIPATGEVWVASDGGIARSTDRGLKWTNPGSSLVTAQYYSLAASEVSTQPALGGTQDNGTLRYDGTESWVQVYGGDGGFTAVDPTNPSVMLTEYVYADVRRSINGGRSWATSKAGIDPTDPTLFITPFVMDGKNPLRVLLGTNRVYLSTSGGVGWQAVSPVLTNGGDRAWISAVAFDPTDPAVAWAGTSDGNLAVTRNLGPGATWSRVEKSPLPSRSVRAIAVDPADGARIFVSHSGFDSTTPEAPGHLFRSTDGGTSWTNVSGQLPDQPVRSIVIDPDAPGRIYLGTDLGAYASFTGGESWWPFGQELPFASVHMLMLDRTHRRLRAGTHGRGAFELDLPVPATIRPIVVPVATHSPGSEGTSWVTDVRIVNTLESTADVELRLTAQGFDRSVPLVQAIQIPPRSTRRLDDVVATLFGLSGVSGRLELLSPCSLVVTARTYNDAASGTFGQFEPGLDSSSAARPDGGAIHLLGLVRSGLFRTNLGLVEIDGRDARASVVLRLPSGAPAGSETFTVPAGGSIQLNDLIGRLAPGVEKPLRAEVTAVEGGGVLAWASVVDNRSGDAVFVPGRPAPADTNSLLLPVATRASGIGGSDWRTDLDVANLAPESRTLSLSFVPAENVSAAIRRELLLAPGESQRMADLVGDFFGTTGTGSIWIETAPIGQGGIAAGARIFTQGSDGASYGQFVVARSASEGARPGETHLLPGLVQNDRFRSNAGFANAGGDVAEVEWQILDASGNRAASGSLAVPPYSLAVRNGLALGLAPFPEGRLELTPRSGNVLAWLSVVDNGTNDPVLVPAISRPTE